MTDTLFPNGLTKEEWDGLQHRLQNGEPNLADNWAVQEADLITIGALTGPESHGLIGWTRREFRYSPHIEEHRRQALALSEWMDGRISEMFTSLDPTPLAPHGVMVFAPVYFRDPDGLSAPVDAKQLSGEGWRLYRGEVEAPKPWTATDVVEVPSPTGNITTTELISVPSKPAYQWKVGDRLLWKHPGVKEICESTVQEMSPRGYIKMDGAWWDVSEYEVVDVLPRVLKEGEGA